MIVIRAPVRRLVILSMWLCLALICSPHSLASQFVAIGEVTVSKTGDAAYTEAMQIALTRATGKRIAKDDPAMGTLLASAQRYIQIYRPAVGAVAGRVTFDSVALERAILAVGQSLWSKDRPLLLGVVTAVSPSLDPMLINSSLESAALERGLPLKLSTASAAGLPLDEYVSAEAAIGAARRLGADAALLGREDGTEWEWTLFDGNSVVVFTGGVPAGVEGAANTFATSARALAAQESGNTMLQVSNVTDLKDYVQLQNLLTAIPGVSEVVVFEVSNVSVVFRVQSAGGRQALMETLAENVYFHALPSVAERLHYRFEH